MNQIENDVMNVMKQVTNRISIPEQGDGWVNLAHLGGYLRDNGIDYSIQGYDKLASFMESLACIELYKDNRYAKPVIYAREKSVIVATPRATTKVKTNDPSKMLMEWAYLGYFPNTMQRLKGMALEEDWGDAENENGEHYYPFLFSYLSYTFYKLFKEDEKTNNKDDKKIKISDDKENAVFNTGLVDHRYKSIHALFKKDDRPNNKPWKLLDFCIEGEGWAGKILVDKFRKMPATAHYFNVVTDMLYDTRLGKPMLDIEHIVVDRVDRLPFEFIRANAPNPYAEMDPDCMSVMERQQYYDNLREAIKSNNDFYRRLTLRIEEALTISFKRVQWNFKSAIPMYYPRIDKMCLFLPLCLVEDNKVDVALVVEKKSSGRYQGSTIYRLDWAYKCARLICRPDSDWLTINASKKQLKNDE